MSNVERFIGVDPGSSGGLACLRSDGSVESAIGTPESDRDLVDWLRAYSSGARAVIERVHSSPQMGVASAFSFGGSYRAVRISLVWAGIAFDDVSPKKWQPAVGIVRVGGKGFGERNGTETKNVNKRRAQELFPTMKVTHAIADALLIAEYCRRLEVRA